MAGGDEYYEDNIKQGKGIVSDTWGSEVLIREVSFSEEESLSRKLIEPSRASTFWRNVLDICAGQKGGQSKGEQSDEWGEW